ncbi:MAG: site-2 protease family protein [Nanoarchaeota archaeon]
MPHLLQKSGRLFSLFGIDIKLHVSWYFIAVLIAWSLASAFFPQILPGKTTITYWLMGIVAALLLFISVLLHELSHSLVAKAKNIGVESITLFFFGGVAGITNEEMKPADEFQMAIAGPLFSLLLSGLFYVIHALNGLDVVAAVTQYLYELNFILALFNLVPGFPLDGGRAFRAILYWHYKDLKKATYIASKGGKFFAGVLIVLGIFGLLKGTGPGLWFILLGGFLYFLAGVSYEQVVMKEVLSRIPVKELVRKVPMLSPGIKFSQLLRLPAFQEEDVFIVKGKSKAREQGFMGLFDPQRVEKAAGDTAIKNWAIPLSQLKPLSKADNAYTAFRRMGDQNLEAWPVLEKGKLLGIVSRRKVMRRLVGELKAGSGK